MLSNSCTYVQYVATERVIMHVSVWFLHHDHVSSCLQFISIMSKDHSTDYLCYASAIDIFRLLHLKKHILNKIQWNSMHGSCNNHVFLLIFLISVSFSRLARQINDCLTLKICASVLYMAKILQNY